MPGQDAAEGLVQASSRLLFAPLFLIHEIVGVLMPGILFGIALLAKRNALVMAALESTIFGYRTKVFIGLFLCYMAGRTFRLPIEMLERHFLWTRFKEWKQSETIDAIKHILIGSAVLPGLLGRTIPLDYIGLAYTNLSFCFTTGLVLTVSSAIPGDHNLRLFELIVGLLMLFNGASQIRAFLRALVVLIGMGVNLQVLLGPIASAITALDKLKGQPAQVTNASEPPRT